MCIRDRLVDLDQLSQAATEMANFYVGKPPMAVQMIKRSVNMIVGALDQSIMHMDYEQHMLASSTEDRNEAVSAYMNKSSPTFTGN